MNAWTLAGVTVNAIMLWMGVTWVFARIRNNAGWVDVAWSYAFTWVAALCLIYGSAPVERKILLGVLLIGWSLRLGTYLAVRVARHPAEDSRYASLRERFPKRPWLMFFAVFQIQGVIVAVLSIPFFAMAFDTSPALEWNEYAGAVLWIIALGGEALADMQAHRFRSQPANRGKVCDKGLWHYSRHPNYFCEWLIWVAFAIAASGAPGGWAGWLSPLVMYYLLTRVTGIPPAEESSLRSRGDAYREYQQKTSPFFPWPGRWPL